MHLTPPTAPLDQLCTIVVQASSLLGNVSYENKRTLRFRKTPLQNTSQGWQYRVSLLGLTQTEQDELTKLEGDMMSLRSELVVQTDASGQLSAILNKEELRSKWAALRPRLLHTYRGSELVTPTMIEGIGYVLQGDGYLEAILRDGYEYGLLFPAFYNQTYTPTPVPTRPRTVARFFGDLNLTFLTQTVQKTDVPPDVTTGLVVKGQLDADTYPEDALRQALRQMTDEPLLDTTLNTEHVESYEFDADRNLMYGAQFTLYGVEGVLFSKTIATIEASAN